eukprot:jgi/Antlo1/755/2277
MPIYIQMPLPIALQSAVLYNMLWTKCMYVGQRQRR